MDFLDPNKKRKNKIKLYVGYVLIAIAIFIALVVLLFVNRGYRLDTKGNVLQNGLLFVNSHPSGADAYIEGVHNKLKLNNKTDTKFELREGRYKVTIQKSGYRAWQRELDIEGGAVERLAYPFLFPKELKTSAIKTYDKEPAIVSSSPDRKWIIIQKPGTLLDFDVYDTSNLDNIEKSITEFKLPDNLLTKPTGTERLEVVEWSSDNSNILMKHTFDDQYEFIIANKDKPELSFNINNSVNQKPFEVSLKDRKVEQLYLHMAPDGLLQLVDTKSKALTPIASKVLAYKGHGNDKLVYITPGDDASKLSKAIIRSNDKDYKLRELPANTNYVVDVAKFDSAWYVVVGAASDNKVYVYKDPMTSLSSANSSKTIFARTLRIENPQKVSFSANARIIAAQSGQKFAIFDAETDRQYRYTINDKFDTNRPVEWMDGHRLVSSTNNQVIVFDFDGSNQQKLMPINNKTDVMFDRDYKNAFSLAPADSAGKSSLSSTLLQVKE